MSCRPGSLRGQWASRFWAGLLAAVGLGWAGWETWVPPNTKVKSKDLQECASECIRQSSGHHHSRAVLLNVSGPPFPRFCAPGASRLPVVSYPKPPFTGFEFKVRRSAFKLTKLDFLEAQPSSQQSIHCLN